MKKLRIGVIYGGRSGEHEVSLASAAAVFKNLDPDRYEPAAVDLHRLTRKQFCRAIVSGHHARKVFWYHCYKALDHVL